MDKKIYKSQVLELFFDKPEESLHIREIARQIKKNPNTVLKDANILAKEGLLLKRATRAVVEIRANNESELFIRLKRLSNLRKIYLSGISDELNKEYGAPKAIILFGSYSRGEDTAKSDVDIAIITKLELKFNCGKYENIFKRKIQIHEIDLKKVSKEFIMNLANGIILKGYLDI